jgi:hypothetical protein
MFFCGEIEQLSDIFFIKWKKRKYCDFKGFFSPFFEKKKINHIET